MTNVAQGHTYVFVIRTKDFSNCVAYELYSRYVSFDVFCDCLSGRTDFEEVIIRL